MPCQPWLIVRPTPDRGSDLCAPRSRVYKAAQEESDPSLIINRYLRHEISRPLVPLVGMLAAIVASYNVTAFLSDTANGLLSPVTIATLVSLKVVISLEVLVPTALYVSVLLTIGRLDTDLEHTAMSALRVPPARMLGAVLTLSASLALVVAGLSLVVRPWAYQELHHIADGAANKINLDAMQAGSFYVDQHGGRVIFLGDRRGPRSAARDVFVRLSRADHMQIIHAGEANLAQRSQVYLNDDHIYDIGGKAQDDQIVDAHGMIMNPNDRADIVPGHSSVAASSISLLTSDAPDDVAELQWRLSTPLSTLLLGLLGLLISRSRSKRRHLTPAAAILIYLGYQLLFTSARIWVQHGVIAEFPGIWWVPGLLGMTLLVAWLRPARQSGFGPQRA